MAKRRTITTIAISLFLLCLLQLTLQETPVFSDALQVQVALHAMLERDAANDDAHSELMPALQRYYEGRQFQPAWMGPEGLAPQGAAFLATLTYAGKELLPKLNTYVSWLQSILLDGNAFLAYGGALPLEAMLQVDVGITQLALSFAAAFDAALLAPLGSVHPPQQMIAARVAEILAGPTWDELRIALCPRQQPFLALRKSLERYLTIRLLGGWPSIPQGPRLQAGLADSRVPLLRKRLIISGDMGLEKLSGDELFDAALLQGVRRFQRRHGLKSDGVVGAHTLAELNTDVQERITQIRLNMIRWRNLPQRPLARYLLVNIPGFRLFMVEDSHVVNSMRAIVGKKDRPTPVLSAMMTYLEINPYWNIPQRIARKDILPKIQIDALFLSRQKIQVFDSWHRGASALDPLAIDWQRYSEAYFPFRLRQQPAASNALGQVKFIFPNRFSVYIHDTPAKSLFGKSSRSFSSGCVRVEKPLDLAQYLLADQHWSNLKIAAKIQSGERQVVVLKSPIPVYLVYLTAWADDNGAVHFFRDLYQRDHTLLAKLHRIKSDFSAMMADLVPVNRMLGRDSRSAAAKSSGIGGDDAS